MKRLPALCLVAAAMLALVRPLWAEDSIVVGVPLPLTGDQAKFGEMEKNSYLMALDEINKAGGVKGKKLELDIQDSQGKPEVARSIVENFIDVKKYPVVVGAYSSSESKQVAAVAQEKKIPYLVVTGSADDITQQGYDYVFRLNHTTEMYPEGLITFLNEVVKPKTVSILYENTDFGTSSSKSFAKVAEQNGWQVLLNEGYEKGALDFKPLLQKVKSANPEVLYMVSYVMDAAKLMNDAKALRVEPKLFVGGGAGFTLPEFQVNAKDAAEYVISVTLWAPEVKYPGARQYAENYKKLYGGESDYHGVQAYAAAYVLADALKRAKSLTPKDIRDAMATTDLMTPYGPVKFISFGKYTNQNKLPSFVLQWLKGQPQTVWPKEYTSASYVFPVPRWKERH